MSQLAQLLRRYRSQRGLSLRAAAELARVSHSYIAKLESVAPDALPPSPPIQTLVRLAGALGIPLEMMLRAAVADAGGHWPDKTTISKESRGAYRVLPSQPPAALPPEERLNYESDARLLQEMLDAKYGLKSK